MNFLMLASLAVSWHGSLATELEASASRHLHVLADPSYEGRMTLSAGNIRARDYIAKQFESFGLQPFHGTSYFFPYRVTAGSRPTANNFAVISGYDKSGQGEWSLEVGKDYVPVLGSQQMRLASGTLVVFGGAKPSGDLSGKFAVLYRRNFSNDGTLTMQSRVDAAVKAGARGVVLVGPSGEGRRELPTLTRNSAIRSTPGFVAVAVTSQVFEKVTGMKYGTNIAAPVELPAKIRTVTETEPNAGESYDVVGMVPGTDPSKSEEYIVIGGHFDHLGRGETGSRSGTDDIHNGADDNASGTSGVLALAQYIAKNPLKHPVIFQTYSGEELGLLGSNAWVEGNPETVKKVHLMINMDMIGRLRENNLTIYCTESAAELPGIVNEVNTMGLKLTLPPGVPGNSDHASFVRANVPALFYHTNLHEEYHTQNDTISTINFDGIGTVLDHVYQTLLKVDALPKKLVFVAPSGTGNARPSNDTTGSGSRRVRVGFIPDMGGDTGGNGMRISGVVQGSPAEAAGVKAGDVLVKFGDIDIKSIEDLQTALVSAKAGVPVNVVVIREGKRLMLVVTPAEPQ